MLVLLDKVRDELRQDETAVTAPRRSRFRMIGAYAGFACLGALIVLAGLWIGGLRRPSPDAVVNEALRSDFRVARLGLRASFDGSRVVLAGRVPTDADLLRAISVAASTGERIDGSGIRAVCTDPRARTAKALAGINPAVLGRLSWREDAGILRVTGSVLCRKDLQALRGQLAKAGGIDLTGVRVTGALLEVRPGDSLWSIAERLYGSGRRFHRLRNPSGGRISDPDGLRVGQTIYAPGVSDSISRTNQ